MIKHLNKKNSKPNRVVVLGAGGFVSSKVSKKLVGKKISVLNLTRKDLSNKIYQNRKIADKRIP